MDMSRKYIFLLAVAGSICIYSHAQEKDARARLLAAHAQYYTPTASGLKSFHCDASIDWQTMLSRFSGKDISADNPFLKFLQTVRLGVTDDLRGKGELEWTNMTDPPEDKKSNVQQMQKGLQTSVAGLFQTWNGFMNGSMVPLPDSTVTVTKSDDGVHLSGKSGEETIDEDYDKNMLLTNVVVSSAAITVLAKPAYTGTPDGLIISSVTSLIHQPPTAPETEATIRINYAKVDTYQVPSHIAMDIKNVGTIEIGLGACKVTVADWAKKN